MFTARAEFMARCTVRIITIVFTARPFTKYMEWDPNHRCTGYSFTVCNSSKVCTQIVRHAFDVRLEHARVPKQHLLSRPSRNITANGCRLPVSQLHSVTRTAPLS